MNDEEAAQARINAARDNVIAWTKCLDRVGYGNGMQGELHQRVAEQYEWSLVLLAKELGVGESLQDIEKQLFDQRGWRADGRRVAEALKKPAPPGLGKAPFPR